jgi:sarcosine oxidase, subunit beta
VGGGVVGAATALWASRAGVRPVVLERRPALCTLTTPASTGAFRLQFDNEEELELVRESVEIFESFTDVTGQRDYELRLLRRGYLWVTTDEARAREQRDLVARQHSWGQTDVELLSGDEVRDRWPYIGENVIQGRFRAGDGFLDPRILTMGLVAGSGALVAVSCGAVGFEIEGGVLRGVRTTRGTISTDLAVVAAGPFSGELASLAEQALPIETVARHKVVMPDLPSVPGAAPMTIDDDTGAHWRPALHGAFLLYTDPSTRPTAPSERVPPDPRLAFGLLDPGSAFSVARVAPFWREVWERNAALWLMQSGQYTMTPDHRPLLGETNVRGLWINTGYSGHGIMGAPAGSRHLVDLFTGKVSSDRNPFRLDRPFAERGLDLL